MNIRNYKKINQNFQAEKLRSLLESENNQQFIEKEVPKQLVDEKETEQLQKIVSIKNKQFTFDCGVSMAVITEDINTLFGLKYHFDKTNSIEEFIESVKQFIESAGYTMSSNDISRLEKQYHKASKQTT